MIIRPVSVPHICLQCRTRLARRPALFPSIINHRRTFQSTTARTADDQSHDEWTEAFTQDKLDDDAKSNSRLASEGERWYSKRRRELSEFPLGRLYGFGGQKLRQHTEKLGIDNLGKPSQVIVLRGAKLDLPKEMLETSKTTSSDETPKERVDIVRLIEQERGLVGHQEVIDNINELRPKAEREIKTWDDVRRFVEELSSGFTVLQLANYMNSHGISGQQEVDGQATLEEVSSSKAHDNHGLNNNTSSEITTPKVQISRWMPGVSESIEHFDRSLHRGYETPEVFSPKARVAFLLIRDCWSLKIPTVENGLGETEIKLDSQDLEWMIKGDSSPLKRITQTLILPGEMIESSRSRGVIRVTSTQERADVLIPAIKYAISKIKYVEFSVDELLPNHRGAAASSLRKQLRDHTMCAELSRLTGTQVSPAAKSKLSVSFVDDSKDGFFDRSDLAKQLLLASSNTMDQSSYKLSCMLPGFDPFVPHDVPTGAFVKHDFSEGLGWRDRLRTWARWSSPVPKTASEEVQEDTAILVVHDDAMGDQSFPYSFSSKKKKASFFPEINRQEKENERTKPIQLGNAAFWSPSRFTSTSTIPGLVLHHGPGTDSFKLKPVVESFQDKCTYNFLSDVPNISRVLGHSDQVKRRTIQNVILRFKPCPWALDSKGKTIGFHALRSFPNIEMRFGIQPSTGEMGLRDVLANISTDISDVMMPHESLDLRFQQATTCRLGNPQRLEEIRKFIEMSTMTDGVPQTPSNIILPIANHLCTPTREDLLTTSASTTNLPTTKVEYLFVGHEVKSTIALDYKGWVLLYSSIQDGKGNNTRSEVRLRATRSPMYAKPAGQRWRPWRESEEYMNASFELAKALSTGVSEGSAVRTVKADRQPVRFIVNREGKDFKTNQGYHMLARRLDFIDDGEEDDDEKDEDETEDTQEAKITLASLFEPALKSSWRPSPRRISDLLDYADELDEEEVFRDDDDDPR
ncbi:hypothetical protein PVAG01_06907 [Phlyctema vagabunda]|uniref:Uncharacterized protein n=1 Tax=Phlyctema vagabunda TaxID=108571 RepID=A0ABR4PID4_9HELO